MDRTTAWRTLIADVSDWKADVGSEALRDMKLYISSTRDVMSLVDSLEGGYNEEKARHWQIRRKSGRGCVLCRGSAQQHEVGRMPHCCFESALSRSLVSSSLLYLRPLSVTWRTPAAKKKKFVGASNKHAIAGELIHPLQHSTMSS